MNDFYILLFPVSLGIELLHIKYPWSWMGEMASMVTKSDPSNCCLQNASRLTFLVENLKYLYSYYVLCLPFNHVAFKLI